MDEEEEGQYSSDTVESVMHTRNAFDRQKALSNHWFFSYLPASSSSSFRSRHYTVAMDYYHDEQQQQRPFWRRYFTYGGFVVAACVALYVNTVWVHPTSDAWYRVTLDAVAARHEVIIRNHLRLSDRYRHVAHWETVEGGVLRANGVQGLHQSEVDAQNASAMYHRAKTAWEEAQQDQVEAVRYGSQAAREHELLEEYERNATRYEQKAQKLEERAKAEGKDYWKYRNISLELFTEVERDVQFKDALLENATLEGQAADNITRAEQNREDRIWLCQWGWTRRYICSPIGGYTELGKVDQLREEETHDYQKAQAVEQQLLIAQTDAMIARTKALRAAEEAKHDYYKALKDKNISQEDQAKASEAHALELKEVQEELEAMRHRHEHLHELEYYQGQEVKLEIRAEKEGNFAAGEWRLGTEMLDEAGADEEKSEQEKRMAEQEAKWQQELMDKSDALGGRLRLYSAVAAAFAFLALVFFITALVTTRNVALGYHVTNIALTLATTVSQHWHRQNASWEGRSILGVHENLNQIRQLSCWCHHCLFFLVVTAMLGDEMESIFEYDNLQMRGEVLLQFAFLTGLMEAMLFQGIPNAAVLESLDREYFKNVAIRFFSSTCRFAIQMLLVLVLFGQGSDWLFGLIHFLNVSYLFWIALLVVTLVLHFWYIETPYFTAMAECNATLSDITSATYHSDITIEVGSLPSSKVNTGKSYQDGEKHATIATLPMGNETESLLSERTPQNWTEESMESPPYSSISLGNSNDSSSAEHVYNSSARRRIYAVSLKSELYSILAHVEVLLLAGSALVVCASLPHIAHRYNLGTRRT